jgi:hypothetical protein
MEDPSTKIIQAIQEKNKRLFEDAVKAAVETTDFFLPSINGASLLHWAAELGSKQSCKLILDHNLVHDVNIRDELGSTALHHVQFILPDFDIQGRRRRKTGVCCVFIILPSECTSH